jgi:ubiquinone/menaquinone biosynthesis C-methylase UbiE
MSSISAYRGVKDEQVDNDSLTITSRYNHKPKHRTGFLGYRDLPNIIKRYVCGNTALDSGCGTGFSTKLLADLDFDVIGVDISERMLSQAKTLYDRLRFLKVEQGRLPFDDNSFDLVLSTFVLFDIPKVSFLIDYLKESQRVLKPQGKFIAVTGSEYFHKNNWLTAKTDPKTNVHLLPGNVFKMYSIELDVCFHDVIYTHDDYLKAFKEAGMVFEALCQPLGKKSDDIAWTTEWDLPPFSVYVCDSGK